ncbi:hypothetical protein [Acidithiobacillus thiooxidans]|uniref:Uncharacterized protein n=1 Tax=Acidithiobacillus thiooxidans ATCC 19377 TaxID=637390 RepID=A0A543Q1I5_ACITH|nr:hypothetical protein [Acidithiobacillus thiooxidans]TQN50183.1 hypothetical protein DLNHIDIE_00020 [Acidithiobacillus thiooxidans ATCC 19377]
MLVLTASVKVDTVLMTPMQEPLRGVERLTGFEDTIGDMQELAHGGNDHLHRAFTP